MRGEAACGNSLLRVVWVEGMMLVSHAQEDDRRTVRWQWGMTIGATALGLLTDLIIVRTLNTTAYGTLAFAQWLATMTLPVVGTGTSATIAPGITSPARRQLIDLQRSQTPPVAAGIFYFLWYRQCRAVFFYCLVYLLLAFPLAKVFNTCPPALLLLAGLSSLPPLLSGVVGITLHSQGRSDLVHGLHLFGEMLS